MFAVLIAAYAATWIFGIRAVKAEHKAELQRFYETQKVFYSEHKAELENNFDWGPMLAHHNGFPSWEDCRQWKAGERDDRYYAIFPFVVLAWREGKHTGENEYHAWSIVDTHLIRRKLRWIE